MADESSVYITGSEPDWAIEKALDSILSELQKTHKDAKEGTKILKKSTSGGKMLDKQAWKEWTSGLKKATKQGFQQGQANKGLIESTKSLNKEFKETTKTFKGVMVGAGLIGGALGMLYENFKATVETFTALNDLGLSTALTYRSLTESLAKTGMSLKVFEDITRKYSTLMGGLGSGGFLGVVSRVGKGFHRFGLSMEEGAEWAAEYLEQQRLLGNYSIYNQRNLNEAVRSNIERLTAYSKVLNISRSELQAAATEAASDNLIRARLARYSQDEQNAMIAALTDAKVGFTAFGASDLSNLFQEGFRFDDPMYSAGIREMLASTAGEFNQAFLDMLIGAGQGIQPGREGMEELGRLAEEFMTERGAELMQRLDPGSEGYSALVAMEELQAGYRQWIAKGNEAQRQAIWESAKQTNDIVDAAAELRTNLGRLEGSVIYFLNDVVETLIGIFGGGSTEETASAGVKSLAAAAGNAAQALLDLANGDKTWSEVFGDIGSWIWEGISEQVGKLWDAGVDKITEWLAIIADEIRMLNPFADKTDVERHTGVSNRNRGEQMRSRGYTEGGVFPSGLTHRTSLELDAAKAMLAEAERDLQVAEARAATSSPMLATPGMAYMPQASAGVDVAVAEARVAAALERIERLTREANDQRDANSGG